MTISSVHYILWGVAQGNIHFPGISFPNTICFLTGTAFAFVVNQPSHRICLISAFSFLFFLEFPTPACWQRCFNFSCYKFPLPTRRYFILTGRDCSNSGLGLQSKCSPDCFILQLLVCLCSKVNPSVRW